jgi:2-hydroxy-6-oxonona-2,4-dienedioate hydrolase/4,5:9,10-diseco-3-hydroxy-5,9,17-trioxoandrosta-1(10),2-diene-4-oate hydrolase
LARRAERVARHALRRVMPFGGMHSRYQTTSFGRMHYYDSQRSGPTARGAEPRTAFLLHGLGSSSLSLLPLATLLRRHCRVIVPDVMHFRGLSEPVKARFTPADHVDALCEFFDSLGVASVDLLGHSIGGAGVLHLATRFPQHTRSVSLVNPGGFSFDFDRIKADLLDVGTSRAERLYEQIVGRLPLLRAPAIKAIGARLLDDALASQGVRDLFEAISEHDFVDPLVREVRCPTLLLWGDDDRFLPRETALYIVAQARAVEAFFVEGGSHLLAVDSPYRVYAMVKPFLGYGRRSSAAPPLPPFARPVLPGKAWPSPTNA